VEKTIDIFKKEKEKRRKKKKELLGDLNLSKRQDYAFRAWICPASGELYVSVPDPPNKLQRDSTQIQLCGHITSKFWNRHLSG
jgi:hypothetical protein